MLPTDSEAHPILLLVSCVLLAAWIGTFQVQRQRWRFELFAVDFALGAFMLSIVAALALGNAGTDLPFSDRLIVASKTAQTLSVAAGVLFGFGNTLLLAAVSLVGVGRAFGIAGSLALAIGALLNRSALHPPVPLIAAAAFALAALLAAMASQSLDPAIPKPKGQPLGPIKLRRSTRGVLVAVLGGVAIGASYPFAQRGCFEEFGTGPYAGLFFNCIGILSVNVLLSLYFFNIAIEGKALPLRTYLHDWPARHLPGLAGGALWSIGALTALLALSGSRSTDVGLRPIAFLPLASVVMAMALGFFLWRELSNTPFRSQLLLAAALLIAACGVAALAFSAA